MNFYYNLKFRLKNSYITKFSSFHLDFFYSKIFFIAPGSYNPQICSKKNSPKYSFGMKLNRKVVSNTPGKIINWQILLFIYSLWLWKNKILCCTA